MSENDRATLDPLAHPICLAWPARRTAIRSWHEHIPFGMLLVDLLRPAVLVELGVHAGDSYCAFCQAVKALNLATRCYGVDSWTGDAHSGLYDTSILDELRAHHDPLYGSFSSLVQSTFDAALPTFADGTIGLLHIDGYHTYDAVKHDFEAWLPKMAADGVIVMHDTNVREYDFGVSRFWDEIKGRYRCFEFEHGYGLGVLAVGDVRSPGLEALLDATPGDAEIVRRFFCQLGHRLSLQDDVDAAERRLEDTQRELAGLARHAQTPTARPVPADAPPPANVLQVFWDADGTFSEARSVTRPFPVDEGIHQVVLPLSSAARGPLRLDPGNVIAYVEIHGVELEARGDDEAEGETIGRWCAAADGARLVPLAGLVRLRGRAAYRFLCTDHDPQLLLEGVPERADARSWFVRVTLRASARLSAVMVDEVRALARAGARQRRRVREREAELASARAALAEQANAMHALAVRLAERLDAFETARTEWRAEHARLVGDLAEHERARQSQADELARARDEVTRLEALAVEWASALAAAQEENARLTARVEAGQYAARAFAADLERSERELLERDGQLRDSERRLLEQGDQLEDRTGALLEKERALLEKVRELQERDRLLRDITASRGWRALNRFRSLKRRLLGGG